MHIGSAQNGLVHAPKTANIDEKFDSLQHLIQTTAASRGTKTANITKILRHFCSENL